MKTLHVSKWSVVGFGNDMVVCQSKVNEKEYCIIDVVRMIVKTAHGEAPIIVRSTGDQLLLSSKVLFNTDLHQLLNDQGGFRASADAVGGFVVSNWNPGVNVTKIANR